MSARLPATESPAVRCQQPLPQIAAPGDMGPGSLVEIFPQGQQAQLPLLRPGPSRSRPRWILTHSVDGKSRPRAIPLDQFTPTGDQIAGCQRLRHLVAELNEVSSRVCQAQLEADHPAKDTEPARLRIPCAQDFVDAVEAQLERFVDPGVSEGLGGLPSGIIWNSSLGSPRRKRAGSIWRSCAGREALVVCSATKVRDGPCGLGPCWNAWRAAGRLRARPARPFIALGLRWVLGLGSCRMAWTSLHKLHQTMARLGRDRLSGRLEVDETHGGGEEEGVRGWQTVAEALVAIAVEVREDGTGIRRFRMSVIADVSARNLLGFAREIGELGITVQTDGWTSYSGLEA